MFIYIARGIRTEDVHVVLGLHIDEGKHNLRVCMIKKIILRLIQFPDNGYEAFNTEVGRFIVLT